MKNTSEHEVNETEISGKTVTTFDSAQFGNSGWYFQVNYDDPHGPYRDEKSALDVARDWIALNA